MYIPDNYDAFIWHENAIERYEKTLPQCACCKEPIRSEKAYDVDGWYCEDCFNAWAEDISTCTENITGEWQ